MKMDVHQMSVRGHRLALVYQLIKTFDEGGERFYAIRRLENSGILSRQTADLLHEAFPMEDAE